ncbi:dihydropteroate synthase [Candidatus Marinamargulisbacteria bacterium SCGC AG-439-L15]|nr:dihydropteroate synthase [Candidatus Marinamargulisbacteria bacterium SCGC AG-439-L15]
MTKQERPTTLPTQQISTLSLESQKSQIMGIVNLTPDSFSDGGQCMDIDAALRQIETLINDGADIIDIGAESTRPGATPISIEEEINRLQPILSVYKQHFEAPLSLDTQKAAVAHYGLENGVDMINDVSAFSDPQMLSVLARYTPAVCIMHMQGTPQTMQKNPQYTDIISEITHFFKEKIAMANSHGLHTIILDPGIGFGKTLDHNLAILKDLHHIKSLGYPVLIGASRKSFIGQLSQNEAPSQRLAGSIAANVIAVNHGASIVRVHDVKEMRQALLVTNGILRSSK